MKSLSVQSKIVALALGSVLVTSLSLLLAVAWATRSLNSYLQEQVRAIAKNSTTELAQSVYQVCAAQGERTKSRLQQSAKVARAELAKAGTITFGDKASWTAVNQVSQKTQTIELPKMLVGNCWLGQNADAKSPSLVVDDVKYYTGDFCTIFQRLNEAGDMLRVCTNVCNANGNRAIGTYIPQVHPDGSKDPVLASVLQGTTYNGRCWVVNKWYDGHYEPIWDSAQKQKVVGMLYIGSPQAEVTRYVYDSFRRMVAGKSGYVFVLQGTGSDRGKYILSKDGTRDGENVWDQKDALEQPVIQSLIKSAIEAQPGAPASVRYPWKNAGDTVARTKIAAVSYYQPWDWVVGVGVYEDDYNDLVKNAVAALTMATEIALACAAVLALLGGLVAAFSARGLVRPIHAAIKVLGKVAKGDLRDDVPQALCERGDEIGQLSRGLQAMVLALRKMVGALADNTGLLGQCSASLSGTATQLAGGAKDTTNQSHNVTAAAEQMSANMNSVAASTEHMSANVRAVASAVDQLTASISEIAHSAEQAAGVAGTAEGLAGEGNSRIAELGAAATEIGKVIEVIQDIAEQTSLLALNATIEAARAGDAGKGFAVVATEVKELAKQTAAATEDIRHRIEGIQASTGHAVNSIGEITEVIKKVNDVSRTIASAVEEQSITTREIAKNVTETSTAAQTVARGVAESATVTRDITKNISDVDAAARLTAQAANVTQTASGKVNEVTEQLHALVGQFTIGV